MSFCELDQQTLPDMSYICEAYNETNDLLVRSHLSSLRGDQYPEYVISKKECCQKIIQPSLSCNGLQWMSSIWDLKTLFGVIFPHLHTTEGFACIMARFPASIDRSWSCPFQDFAIKLKGEISPMLGVKIVLEIEGSCQKEKSMKNDCFYKGCQFMLSFCFMLWSKSKKSNLSFG